MSDEDPLELTADERRALIAPLRQTLDYAHFPLAPRLDPLKSILAKLDPPNQSQNRNRGRHCRRMPAPGLADIGGDHEPLHRPANDARQRRYGARIPGRAGAAAMAARYGADNRRRLALAACVRPMRQPAPRHGG